MDLANSAPVAGAAILAVMSRVRTLAGRLAGAALLLLSGAGLAAADVMEGWGAYEAGDYARALELFSDDAVAGDPEAQYALGWLYGNGMGVPQDYAAALMWYERSARQGNMDAQNSAGFIHDLGLAGPPDTDMAEFWYGEAASQGSIVAQNNLAYRWSLDGRNLDEALDLIRNVVRTERSNSAYLDTLGWVLYQLDRFQDAIPPLCEAVKLEPGHPELRVHLGDAYWQVGRDLDAHYQWGRALRLLSEPEALSEDGRLFVRTRPPSWRQSLEERLASGLSRRDDLTPSEAPPAAVERSFTDECAVPTS
ncbi:MAG: tetratricopeptide repeat protein [Alphaproteobacteria bacterium]